MTVSPATVLAVVRQVRSPSPLLVFLLAWGLCAWAVQGWWRGLGALATMTVFFLAWRFAKWRRARLALLRRADLPVPNLARLVGRYLQQLVLILLLRWRWRTTCEAVTSLSTPVLKRTPPLRYIRSTVNNDIEARIFPGAHQLDVDAFLEQQSKLAGRIRFGCRSVAIRQTEPGNAAVQFFFSRDFDRVLSLADVPESPAGTICYGKRLDGRAATILQSQSLIIGGLTRRGKSVVGKALVHDLLRKQVPFRLHIADLKDGIELPEFATPGQYGYMSVGSYETTVKGVTAMLTRVEGIMQARAKAMVEQGVKQWTPTEQDPLEIVWLDETIPMKGLLKVESSAGKIAYTGAGRCTVLWLNTQLGEKSILGDIRDLIPQRLCFETQTWQQTDMVLGDGAHLAGALCHRLHDKPGVGYSGSDGDHSYEIFRAANVTPAEAARIAKGVVQARAPQPVAEHYLYRGWQEVPGKPDRLVYVGETNDTRRRFGEHRRNAWKWCQEHRRMENVWAVHVTYTTEEKFPSRDAARKAERAAIESEFPVFNDRHNRGASLGRRVRAVAHRAPKATRKTPEPKPASRPVAAPRIVEERLHQFDGSWSE